MTALLTVDDMARKTAKKPEPEPEPAGRKPVVVQMRGSEAWKGWIEELAGVEKDTVAKFIERLAYRHAKAIGFREMPDR